MSCFNSQTEDCCVLPSFKETQFGAIPPKAQSINLAVTAVAFGATTATRVFANQICLIWLACAIDEGAVAGDWSVTELKHRITYQAHIHMQLE